MNEDDRTPGNPLSGFSAPESGLSMPKDSLIKPKSVLYQKNEHIAPSTDYLPAPAETRPSVENKEKKRLEEHVDIMKVVRNEAGGLSFDLVDQSKLTRTSEGAVILQREDGATLGNVYFGRSIEESSQIQILVNQEHGLKVGDFFLGFSKATTENSRVAGALIQGPDGLSIKSNSTSEKKNLVHPYIDSSGSFTRETDGVTIKEGLSVHFDRAHLEKAKNAGVQVEIPETDGGKSILEVGVQGIGNGVESVSVKIIDISDYEQA